MSYQKPALPLAVFLAILFRRLHLYSLSKNKLRIRWKNLAT